MDLRLKGLFLSLLILSAFGCRNVTIVSDSLFANNALVPAQDILVGAINNTNQENYVFTKSIQPGSAAYNNPINYKVYSKGLSTAFGNPDALVLSFATNDMAAVSSGAISYESAFEAFWTLVHQSVQAGAECVVLTEWSHHFHSGAGVISTHPGHIAFSESMDQWFADMEAKVGDRTYLGFPYKFVIADVSDAVHADMGAYVLDYIHPTPAGSQLIADAVVEALSTCPEGNWIYGVGLKSGYVPRQPKWLHFPPLI